MDNYNKVKPQTDPINLYMFGKIII